MKISDEDQQKMERILWDGRYVNVNLNWHGLAKEAGVEVDVNPRTLHRTMGTLGYRRCLACPKNWVHKRAREKRVEYARRMLEAYPQPLDWRQIRFSLELHFGFGLDGKMRLIPRPGEKFCSECSEKPEANWARDIRKVHAWVAVGYGFKSEPLFYEDSTSPNCTGTMTLNDYRDRVLAKSVKPWLVSRGAQTFILEEDTETFAHGAMSKVNIVQQWKDEHGLRYYFNCGDCPDLSPLETLWPQYKQWTLEAPKGWDDDALKGMVKEAWRGFDIERTNMWVDFMPQRLRQVIESDGGLVAW